MAASARPCSFRCWQLAVALPLASRPSPPEASQLLHVTQLRGTRAPSTPIKRTKPCRQLALALDEQLDVVNIESFGARIAMPHFEAHLVPAEHHPYVSGRYRRAIVLAPVDAHRVSVAHRHAAFRPLVVTGAASAFGYDLIATFAGPPLGNTIASLR